MASIYDGKTEGVGHILSDSTRAPRSESAPHKEGYMHQCVRYKSFIRLGIALGIFRLGTMAMNPFKTSFIVGLTSGLVAVVIAPVLIPVLKRGSRPIAKELIKGGMALYEKGREVAAYAGEMVEDFMAEIQSEQAERQSGGTAESEWEEKEPSMEKGGNSPLDPTLAEEGKDRVSQNRAASA